MFNKKFLSLLTWYVLGWLVASIYSKKNSWDLEKELKKTHKSWEWELTVLLNNFIETHKNLLDSIKKEPFYKNNKKIFIAKKAEFLKSAGEYKIEWKELINELKLKGKDYASETYKKLEKLYESKKEELESFKDTAPEKVSVLKNRLLASYEETKEKIKEKVNNDDTFENKQINKQTTKQINKKLK